MASNPLGGMAHLAQLAAEQAAVATERPPNKRPFSPVSNDARPVRPRHDRVSEGGAAASKGVPAGSAERVPAKGVEAAEEV